MNTTVQKHLQNLQAIFNTTDLGEGDPVAGLNTLAAMACSIAGVARPGSGLLADNGKVLQVGTNLLISGSHSCSLATDSVVVGMGRRQNNLGAQLRRLDQDARKEAAKNTAKSWSLPPGPGSNEGEQALVTLQQPDPLLMGTTEQGWAQVLSQPPSTRFADLAERHRVYGTASKAGDLEKQLEQCHMGRPFAHLGVNRTSDFRGLQDLAPAIMDGRATQESTGESIRGTVMVTDQGGVLGETLQSGDPDCGWLGRLLWLVDGPAGPEPTDPPKGEVPVALNDLNQRYEDALDRAWADRINNHHSHPAFLKYELGAWQTHWVAFLRKRESDLPGITGTARNLLATLVFGLQELVSAAKAPKGFRWQFEGIEALARFLVHRMANARAAALYSAEQAFRHQLQERVLHKLVDGPLSTRKLVRRFNRLRTDDCRNTLLDLLALQKVVRVKDDLWRLSESTMAEMKGLTLDV